MTLRGGGGLPATLRDVPPRVLVWAAAGLLAGCVTTSSGLPNAKPNLVRAAQINTQLGADYAQRAEYARAKAKLQRAISENSDYAPAHATLAFVYWRTGKPAEAEREYRRALDLDPDDPDTQNNFGTFLCRQGKGGQAQKYFQRALANPNYATPAAAWTNAGVCALTMNKPRVAERDFESALHADPNFVQALDQLAQLSFQRGRYLRAQALEQHYASLAKPGPAMLLLSAQTERALGHAARARDLEVQLVQTYPQSQEAAHTNVSSP
ncbi:MAG TPA: type IV pilus biogenesis/stability protein PilW [Nevskiaceae bacterium]|nr:type IV pilus biogenesis/stability protein PilW [Nevskiaceae bacterium]